MLYETLQPTDWPLTGPDPVKTGASETGRHAISMHVAPQLTDDGSTLATSMSISN
jgi:hypothetical protein